ncbi:hypothetical protein D9M73_263820 [compost metagenome]
MLAGAAQHDDLHFIVIAGPAKRRVQRISHLRVLCVVVLGAVHGDDCHRVAHFVQDHLGLVLVVMFSHHLSPKTRALSAGLAGCL